MLAPDELILRIRVPVTPLGRASTYHKIRDRESYAFALASAAVAFGWTAISCAMRASPSAASPRVLGAPGGGENIGRPAIDLQTARAAGEAALQGAKAPTTTLRIELGARTVADALMIAKARR